MTGGLLILAVVILHNLLGYLTGFGVGKLLKLICAVFLSLPVSRTVAQRQTSREQKGT